MSAEEPPVKPTIAVTMGDPAGIGPEVIVKALADDEIAGLASYVVLGDQGAFDVQGVRNPLQGVPDTLRCDSHIALEDFANAPPEAIAARRPTTEGGRASVDYIERAVRMCLAGEADAMVTAPISKAALKMAGAPYPGHTELLADRTGAARHAMMFASPRLRVTLVTIHRSLRSVLDTLTPEAVRDAVDLTHRALTDWFGLDRPRIALAGVNPHASEGGLFGDEEARILEPALETVRGEGVDCAGPLPADTVFLRAAEGAFDAVVAVYHDQGLIPVKLLGFHDAVNLTLGLPIVRTSVDHGTAYDIAGQAKADPGSMKAAIRLAVKIAERAKGKGVRNPLGS